MDKAQRVAAVSGSVAVSGTGEVPGDADFYLMAVSDNAIAEVASRFSGRKGTWVHTAGAVGMDPLAANFEHYGVLYPLQTLSQQRQVSLVDTPFLVEGSSRDVFMKIHALASSITENVVEMDSVNRLNVHLAAVFANNFSNHMVTIATRIMEENGAGFPMLEPLIRETFSKMIETGPAGAQTGPAVRGDDETILKHLELLKGNPDWQKLYTFMSRDILQSCKSINDPKRGDDQL